MDMSLLSNNIIKNLSSIPGILGFCNIDASNKELKDENTWTQSLSINHKDDIVSFNVAIIIAVDSTINNIAQQIKQKIKFNFQNMNYTLGTINIYIKGVK